MIAKGKGKQRETRLDDHNVVFGEEAPPSSPTPAPAPRLVRTMGLPGPSPKGTTLGPVFPVGDFQEVSTIDPDVEMLDSSKGDSLTVEEISEVEPVDWKIKVCLHARFPIDRISQQYISQVHDILFGHAIALPNKSKSFTLPLLMHLHIEKDTPASALSEHNVACDGLLKALRAPSDIVDEGVYISTIANSLVSLVGIFNVASSVSV